MIYGPYEAAYHYSPKGHETLNTEQRDMIWKGDKELKLSKSKGILITDR